MNSSSIPIVTVIGKSGCGKTTLLEKLIAELSVRHYHIGTVKHHSHAGFEIDKPGKDSWRHARAGSRHVIIAAPDKIASYRLLDRELSLDEIAAGVDDVDIIFAEGYASAGKPALELVRSANNTTLIGTPNQRFAVASDVPLEAGVPRYDLDDIQGIADLIEREFLQK